jgi:DNA modification methylase
MRTGLIPRAQIIWAKDRLVLSRGDYHWQHEPCLYAVRDGAAAHRTDDRTQTTLWTIPARDDAGHGHGTQKPVECMRRPIQNHTIPEIYEPFAGSGTTLIAAEQLGRRCLAIEIEPRYVQMAIDRWEAFSGQKAVKVGEAVNA